MLALANGVMLCKNTTICWWNGGNILQTWLEMVQLQGINNVVVRKSPSRQRSLHPGDIRPLDLVPEGRLSRRSKGW